MPRSIFHTILIVWAAIASPAAGQEWSEIFAGFLDGGAAKAIAALESHDYHCEEHGGWTDYGDFYTRFLMAGRSDRFEGFVYCRRGEPVGVRWASDGVTADGKLVVDLHPDMHRDIDYVVIGHAGGYEKMDLSCKALGVCDGSWPRFVERTAATFSLSPIGEVADKVHCGIIDIDSAFCINASLFRRQELQIRMEPSHRVRERVSAYSEKVARECELRLAGPLFRGAVSRSEFDRFIQLDCGSTVNCDSHQHVLNAMHRAYGVLRTSGNRYVRLGYLDACARAISVVDRFPVQLRGRAGGYTPQFSACNAGLYYHFELDRR